MICEVCQENGHYWFAEDDEELPKELEDLIGVYAYCDMRQVFATSIPCECGCHTKNNKPQSELDRLLKPKETNWQWKPKINKVG